MIGYAESWVGRPALSCNPYELDIIRMKMTILFVYLSPFIRTCALCCSGVWRKAVHRTLIDDDWRQISGSTLRFANVCTKRCWWGKISRLRLGDWYVRSLPDAMGFHGHKLQELRGIPFCQKIKFLTKWINLHPDLSHIDLEMSSFEAWRYMGSNQSVLSVHRDPLINSNRTQRLGSIWFPTIIAAAYACTYYSDECHHCCHYLLYLLYTALFCPLAERLLIICFFLLLNLRASTRYAVQSW